MIVMLLVVYPMIGANRLVGTGLTQAVPLTLASALGALAFGHVELSVTGSLILGSVPAVFVGSLLSSTIPDRYVRTTRAIAPYAAGQPLLDVVLRARSYPADLDQRGEALPDLLDPVLAHGARAQARRGRGDLVHVRRSSTNARISSVTAMTSVDVHG